MMNAMMNTWNLLGADEAAREAALRAVVVDFYARVERDPLIGFFFAGRSIERLIELEVQFTRRLLGGPAGYAGRPIRLAHAKLPILSGHFDRRQQILRETLGDHAVPQEVASVWLEHNEKLRAQIVGPTTREPAPGDGA